jgi:hypothetical protein
MSLRFVRRVAMTAVAAVLLVLATFVTARATRVGAGPYTPTPTPTPTPTTTFTNNTGEAAGFLHLQSNDSGALPSVNAPGCGVPTVFGGGFEYWEIVWPSPCVDPGESVSFELPAFTMIYFYYWAPSVPVVSAVNDTGLPSNDLRIATASFTKGATLVQNAPGCPAPFYQFPSSGTVELTWSSLCVDPGEKVSIHIGAPGPVTSASFFWSGPVGGVSLDPSDTPLDSSSSGTAMLLTAVAGVVAVGIIALGSAPWFARRRRVR